MPSRLASNTRVIKRVANLSLVVGQMKLFTAVGVTLNDDKYLCL
jgi:hypothetical protein